MRPGLPWVLIPGCRALHIGNVRATATQWQGRIVVVEHNTGKSKNFPLNASVKQIVGAYLATRPDMALSDPLFSSRSGDGPLPWDQQWDVFFQNNETPL